MGDGDISERIDAGVSVKKGVSVAEHKLVRQNDMVCIYKRSVSLDTPLMAPRITHRDAVLL